MRGNNKLAILLCVAIILALIVQLLLRVYVEDMPMKGKPRSLFIDDNPNGYISLYDEFIITIFVILMNF